MIRRIFGKMFKKLNNSVGASLAEMLVCAAFVGIISVLVTAGIIFSYRVTAEIKSESYANTVSRMILDKVSGVISQAIAPGNRKVYLSDNCIGFETADSCPVMIFATPDKITPVNKAVEVQEEYAPFNNKTYGTGYLNLYYCQLKTGNATNPPSLWTFPRKSYMDYSIDELKFTPLVHNNKLIIQVELTISRTDGVGEPYTETSTVNCYNIQDPADNYEILAGTDFPFSYLNKIWTTE